MLTSLVPACKRAPRKSRARYSRAIRAAYRLLHIKPGSTKTQINAAFKRAARSAHPDQGGSNTAMLALQCAQSICLAALPKRGRPRRYSRHDLFAVVNVLTAEVVAGMDGFRSRAEAQAALDKLRAAADSQVPDGKGNPARFRVQGSPGSERTRKWRHSQRWKKTAAHWNYVLSQLGLSAGAGACMTDAPSGCGELVTGGMDGAKLSGIVAARTAVQGGPTTSDVPPARRVRAGGAPPDKMMLDESSDSADEGGNRFNPQGHLDDQRQTWDDPEHPMITGSQVDPLLDDSCEDELPRYKGWNIPERIPTADYDEEDDDRDRELAVHEDIALPRPYDEPDESDEEELDGFQVVDPDVAYDQPRRLPREKVNPVLPDRPPAKTLGGKK
jgi:hypothetical protein